jgi:3-phenylpropionate/trans-cinnamate dioxygenase ferredoxin subunit
MRPGVHTVRVCRLDEFPPGTMREVDSLPPIVLFNVEGHIYAIDDVCSHAFSLLSEGYFDGTTVECPLHMSRFDVRTGEPLCPPATEPVRTHKVEIVDGEVTVHVGLSADSVSED